MQSTKALLRQLLALLLALCALIAAVSMTSAEHSTDRNATDAHTNHTISHLHNNTNSSENRNIALALRYQHSTPFDSNDDGITITTSAIDFTVQDTRFSWEATASTICTHWAVTSLNTLHTTLLCQGATLCCSLVELSPLHANWDDDFVIFNGSYGATLNNTVSAQVISADYSFAPDDLHVDIHYSNWSKLPASFFEPPLTAVSTFITPLPPLLAVPHGNILLLNTTLLSQNNTPLAEESLHLLRNGTLLASQLTTLLGTASFPLNTLSAPPGDYLLNISFPGRTFHTDTETISLLPQSHSTLLTVLPVNHPPFCQLVNHTLPPAGSLPFLPDNYCADADGDVLHYTLTVTGNATLAQDSSTFIFQHAENRTGTARITLTASDGNLSTTASFNLTLAASNIPPLFSALPNITIFKNGNATLNLAAYTTNADNDLLHFSAVQPQNISILLSDHLALIIPHPNFTGTRAITFIVNDSAATATAQSTVTVIAPAETTAVNPDSINASLTLIREIPTRVPPVQDISITLLIAAEHTVLPLNATLTVLLPALWNVTTLPATATIDGALLTIPVELTGNLTNVSYTLHSPAAAANSTFTTTLQHSNTSRTYLDNVTTDATDVPFAITSRITAHNGLNLPPVLATNISYELVFSITHLGQSSITKYPVIFTWPYNQSQLQLGNVAGCSNQRIISHQNISALECRWQPFLKNAEKTITVTLTPLAIGLHVTTLNTTYDPPLLITSPHNSSLPPLPMQILSFAKSTDVIWLARPAHLTPHLTRAASAMAQHLVAPADPLQTLTAPFLPSSTGTAVPFLQPHILSAAGLHLATQTFAFLTSLGVELADFSAGLKNGITGNVVAQPPFHDAVTPPPLQPSPPAELPSPSTPPPAPLAQQPRTASSTPKTPPLPLPASGGGGSSSSSGGSAAQPPASPPVPAPAPAFAKVWHPTHRDFGLLLADYAPPFPATTLFARSLSCSRCDNFSVPAQTAVNVTLHAYNFKTADATVLTEFYPADWNVSADDTSTLAAHNATHNTIRWAVPAGLLSIARSYMMTAPANATAASFHMELGTGGNTAVEPPRTVLVSPFSVAVTSASSAIVPAQSKITTVHQETSDAVVVDLEVTINTAKVKRITFANLTVPRNSTLSIGYDDVPESKEDFSGMNFLKVYALDPSNLTFTTGELTAIAKGTRLLKCETWNFTAQHCTGNWTPILNLIPGQSYSVVLNASDPAWAEEGLVAINTHKSIYLPGELAKIGIGVLDKAGHVVCDANVTLAITTPSGSTTTFTTVNGSIAVSPQCFVLGVTSEADYFTNYTVSETGSYEMNLTAVTADGTPFMLSNFSVASSVAFDVERSGPTRIYPAVPYDSNFTITANQQHNGNITETIPATFAVSTDAMVVTQGSSKLLIWNVSFANGGIYHYGYLFDAPDTSPFRYELGPLQIGGWSEMRQWHIASDAVQTAAGENADIVLRVQGCRLEDSQTSPRTFSSACTGTYPSSTCSSTTDKLSCNDGSEETASFSNGKYAGLNITAYNATLIACDSIISVRVCHDWRLSAAVGVTSCNIGTHDGDLSWNLTSVTCPSTTPSGTVCTDVTSKEAWTCNKFFGSSSVRASAMIEAQRNTGGSSESIFFDALYFNVTYFADTDAPNNTLILPRSGTNISGNVLVNASINDTSTVANANLTIYNNTGNATGRIPMLLGSGTATAGYWNVTFNSATLRDGRYNFSINASDAASVSNYGFSPNISVVIDNTAANVSTVVPLNGSNFSQAFLINASANDTLSNVAAVSFRLIRAADASSWSAASLTTGTIAAGYWTATLSPAGISGGTYNITINATDFANNQRLVNISSVTVDTNVTNATAITPLNLSNITTNFLVNLSVNDSVSSVFNVTFRLISPAVTTGWYAMSLSSGSRNTGYWNATVTAASLADGRYNISVNATDFAGNQHLLNVSSIRIDRLAANASIMTPRNATNTSSNFLINASVNDTVTGVLNATFRLISASYASPWLFANKGAGDIHVGYWNHTFSIGSISNGFYNITINATDFANNQLIANISRIAVDTVQPNSSAAAPANSSNTSTSFLMNASANDNLTGIFALSFRLTNPLSSSGWTAATLGTGTIIQGFWSAAIDISGLADNAYNVTANATDFAGNQNLANLSAVFVDNTLPNATVIFPLNRTNTSADFLINASANDSFTGVLNVTFRLSRNGFVTPWLFADMSSGSIAVGYWNTTVDISGLTDAAYNITVNATDFSNNQRLVNSSLVVIDRDIANISALAPANNSNFSKTFLINASVNDSVSGILNTSYRLTNATFATAWLFADMSSGSIAAGYWNATPGISSLADGRYNISANATDFAGNQRLINTSSVTLDRSTANVSIVNLLNDTVVSSTLLINASVNDSLSLVAAASYRLLNATASSAWIPATLNSGTINQGYWHAEFDTLLLPNAVYNLTVNATDFAGNQHLVNISQVEINNIIDLIPPNITVLLPFNNSNISALFLVNASINDTHGVVELANVTLSNSSANVTGMILLSLGAGTTTSGYWNATLDSTAFIDGFYNLTVNATDRAANSNVSPNISLLIDNTVPNASVMLPANESNFTSESFLINISVNDTHAQLFNVTFRLTTAHTDASVSWLSATLGSGSIAQGYWNLTFPSSSVESSRYNLTVNATDFAGNQFVANLSHFRIDRDNPNASAVTPPNETNVSSNFLVNLSTNDSVSDVLNVSFRLISSADSTAWLGTTVGSGSASVGYWNRTFAISLVTDGRYNLSVNATDFARNQLLANISSVIIDRSAPNLSILTPLNGTNITAAYLINASANDSLTGLQYVAFQLVGTAGTSAWIAATLGVGNIAQGYWNTTIAPSAVPDGDYNITANGTDFAGNQNLANLTAITIDTTAPNASIIVPLNLTSTTSDFLVNISVNDSTTTPHYAAFRLINAEAATSWTALTLGAGTARVGYWNATADISSLQDGRYNISVNATDFAGNQRLVNLSMVTIDRLTANASMLAPLNHTNHSTAFLLNASVNDSMSGVFNTTFRLVSPASSSSWLFTSRSSGTPYTGYWNATFTPGTIADGRYNISVNTTDFAGNQIISNTSAVVLDTTPVNFSAVSPANQTNTSSDVLVNASANDSTSQVSGMAFRLVSPLASSAWTAASLGVGTIAAGYWNATLDVSSLADQRYNLTANGTDFAGNQQLANISSIVLDRIAPNTTMIGILNNSDIVSLLLLNASVNDTLSGTASVSYRFINANGTTITAWIPASLGIGTIAASYWNVTFNTVSIGDDLYNITILATDFAGNQQLLNLSTVNIVNNRVFAASENADVLLRAQSCSRESASLSSQTFNLACLGTYPASCTTDRLSCNDAVSETASLDGGEYGGVNLSSYNSTITNCIAVSTVRLCYEWSIADAKAYGSCQVGVDKGGDLSWASTGAVCPTTTPNLVRCVDITSLEGSWSCSDFFRISAPAVWAYIEAQRTEAAGPSHTMSIDAFYFNITYSRDIFPPRSHIVVPSHNGNVSGSFVVNASINDTVSVELANLTMYNTTGNVTGRLPLSQNAGTATVGYWNATINTSTLQDSRYNLSIIAADPSGNTNFSQNISVTVDNTAANISPVSFINHTNHSFSFTMNASANDSLSGVRNVSFRFSNSTGASNWFYAALNAGTITAGYWHAVIASGVADGAYNVTMNGTDFAGSQRLANISAVLVDNTPPPISLISPANGTNTSVGFLINASANDSFTGVLNVTFRLSRNGFVTPWLFADMSSGSIAVGYWNTTVDISGLTDAAYNITVNATDFAGNQQLANISSIVLDRVAPNATMITPGNNSNFTLSLTLNASVNDSQSNVFNVSFRLINPRETTAWQHAALNAGTIHSGYWNATLNTSLENGFYNISVNATDFAGNQFLSNISEIVIVQGPLFLNATFDNTTGAFTLNWSNVSYADSFAVFISLNHTTFANMPNVTGITDLNWTDADASRQPLRFYRVAAIRSLANATSNLTAGKHLAVLGGGWNMVSWPLDLNLQWLQNSTHNGYELPLSPGNCVGQIWRYNASMADPWELMTREGDAWLPATGDENFTFLEPYRAYWLYNNLSQNCNLTFAGTVPVPVANVSLVPGFNLNAWHSEDTPSLPQNCAADYPLAVTPDNNITTLYYYNTTQARFKGSAHYTWSGCGADTSWGWLPDSLSAEFASLTPGKGYYLTSTHPANWTVEPRR